MSTAIEILSAVLAIIGIYSIGYHVGENKGYWQGHKDGRGI